MCGCECKEENETEKNEDSRFFLLLRQHEESYNESMSINRGMKVKNKPDLLCKIRLGKIGAPPR
jgi:hypothetical protein